MSRFMIARVIYTQRITLADKTRCTASHTSTRMHNIIISTHNIAYRVLQCHVVGVETLHVTARDKVTRTR
jgi:hypothetical protein